MDYDGGKWMCAVDNLLQVGSQDLDLSPACIYSAHP